MTGPRPLDVVEWCLRQSATRSRAYAASGDEHSLKIERGVQDRLLAERKEATS